MADNLQIKKSVASVYETETFCSSLNDILHPGGAELTRRVAQVAGVNENSRVLDIACGKGGSCRLLTEEYRCDVTGMDISEKSIASAADRAQYSRKTIHFIVGDAENMPLTNETFDIVLAECSFSILTDKIKAASEISRVMKPGGRLVISDIVLKKKWENDSQQKLRACAFPLVPCITKAQILQDYIDIFESVGLNSPYIEDYSIELRKIGYNLAIKFGGWKNFLDALSDELRRDNKLTTRGNHNDIVEIYSELLSQASLGYSLIRVNKPC